MRKAILTVCILVLCAFPVRSLDITAPEVPDSGRVFMPEERENLLEAIGEMLWDGLMALNPGLKEASMMCIGVIGAVMVVSLTKSIPGSPEKTVELAGTALVSVLLLRSSGSMVNLAASTVRELSEYGKLLIPVMTAALAGQGSVSRSAALYGATAFFDAILSSAISGLLIPMVYLYLALAVACAAVTDQSLGRLRDQLKNLVTRSLKTALYIFTGFISLTGVVSGATDATALKAAKMTISTAVPVVGGILSDASEAVLVTAGLVKNSAGIYGMLAVLAIWLGPFLEIGAQYLLLQASELVCGLFGVKAHTQLLKDYASGLGLLLAMTGTVCLMLLVSLFCYMKGAG